MPMSFSPLNPRNQRQRMTPSRIAGKRDRRQPARHLRLWEAIRLTRSELSDWQQRTALVDGLFRQHILPRETQLTGVHGELTERLMDNYAEDWLGSSDQALLNLWISDKLQSLASHPFAAESQREALKHRWQQLLQAEAGSHGEQSKPSSRTLLDELFDDELDEDDEIFDFGWHGNGRNHQSPSADQSAQDDHDSASDTVPNGDEAVSDTANHQARKENGNTSERIDQLEQRLSVERLFRQLARELHPDREQDETRKAEKHELMSECLLARQNKDINTLLTLYCEHVGDLPDDLSGNEHEELIQALEQQLRQLQNELRQERFGNPLLAQIIERYSASDEQQTRQRVTRHADSLDKEIARLHRCLQQLDSREGLLAELAERREIEQNRMIIDSMTGYSPGR